MSSSFLCLTRQAPNLVTRVKRGADLFVAEAANPR
jgi:hypothetical protein